MDAVLQGSMSLIIVSTVHIDGNSSCNRKTGYGGAARIEWSRLLDKELEEANVAILPGKYQWPGLRWLFRLSFLCFLLLCARVSEVECLSE